LEWTYICNGQEGQDYHNQGYNFKVPKISVVIRLVP